MSTYSARRQRNRDVVKAERARYMAHEISHSDYYSFLADLLAVPYDLIPATPEEIRHSTDPPLNDVPLHRWDRMHGAVVILANREGVPWSISDTVCVLKELARRRLREEDAEDAR